MTIEMMEMGKYSEEKSKEESAKKKGMKIGDTAKKKLAKMQMMQDNMDMASVAMLKKFNLVELEAMEKAHSKLKDSHRRIISMIDSLEEY